MEKKRVYALYRVSTKRQVDRIENRKDDIPMQKQRCREFAEQMGWEIVKEVKELGVSGFKVSAKDRDAIIEIQEAAALGKFDILLVFMFDRIGRKEDETPFVVEWFVRNGVEVWSAEEGQQKLDSHVDKLMNYIRYWQASGESLKTSIRTKTRLAQLVQEGCYRGGTPPYGYRLEKRGRVNKRNHECYDLVIDEHEAQVVKLIFEKYVNEGIGGHRLVRYLLDHGIRNRTGDNFPNTSITRMLKNIAYICVLKSNDTYSDMFEHLQIIDPEMFERAQEIMRKRAEKLKHSDVPLNTKGKSLLAGLVYCGHGGNKLTLTTSGTRCRTEDGQIVRQVRYCCHYKVRHPQSCDGQSGYGTVKLDRIVDTLILEMFRSVKAASKSELTQAHVHAQTQLKEHVLLLAEKTLKEKQRELALYQEEIAKVLRGESPWDSQVLNDMILKAREEIAGYEAEYIQARADYENTAQLAQEAQRKYDDVKNWADLYLMSSTEAKKMIAYQLIKQVRISRNYVLEIDLNVGYEQFAGFLHTTNYQDLVVERIAQ